MPANIEIKARVADLANTCRLAETICNAPPIKIEQDDTFFFCPNGRLKLRHMRWAPEFRPADKL